AARALPSAGSRIAIKTEMIATTTSNSTRVKAGGFFALSPLHDLKTDAYPMIQNLLKGRREECLSLRTAAINTSKKATRLLSAAYVAAENSSHLQHVEHCCRRGENEETPPEV